MKRNDSRKIKREIENWKKKEKKIGLIIIDPFLNKYIYIYIYSNTGYIINFRMIQNVKKII